MAEARARKTSQFTSNIFQDNQPEAPRRVRSVNKKNYESQIFTPAEAKPSRMSYSREKYFESNEIFSKESFMAPEAPVQNSNTSMKPAGFKDRYTPPDHLIGNGRSVFSQKSEKNLPEAFQPKFQELTVQERIEKELYGGFHIYHSSQNKKIKKYEQTAKQRKKNNLLTSFDKTNDENIPPNTEKKQPAEYSPGKRKHEILASSVFDEKTVQDYPRLSRKDEFDGNRKKHHLYSDLSGRFEEYKNSKCDKLVSSSHAWLYEQSKPNNFSYDPKARTLDYFRSSLTPEPHKATRTRSIEPSPTQSSGNIKSFTLTSKQLKIEELRSKLEPLQEFAEKTPEVFDLVLTKIPTNFDKINLRKLCEGMHIISTELDTDNFTGVNKGTGTIKLRCSNEKKLKNFEYKLLKEGIETRPRAKSNKVKNTWYYTNNDQKFESDPKCTKVKEQQSNVFGRPRRFTPVRQKRDTAFQSLIQWKKTKSARREVF